MVLMTHPRSFIHVTFEYWTILLLLCVHASRALSDEPYHIDQIETLVNGSSFVMASMVLMTHPKPFIHPFDHCILIKFAPCASLTCFIRWALSQQPNWMFCKEEKFCGGLDMVLLTHPNPCPDVNPRGWRDYALLVFNLMNSMVVGCIQCISINRKEDNNEVSLGECSWEDSHINPLYLLNLTPTKKIQKRHICIFSERSDKWFKRSKQLDKHPVRKNGETV